MHLKQGVPNNNIMGTPLNTCSSAIVFSIASIMYYFRIQPTIPSQRSVLGISISNQEANHPPRAENDNFLHPSCQTEVDGHIIYIMGIPLNTCTSAILFSIIHIIYYFRIQTTIPSQRGVSGITLSYLEGNQSPRTKKWQFSTPPAVKLKFVGILSALWESP